MKRTLILTIALAALVFWAVQHHTVAAHPGEHEKNAFTPRIEIPWGPVPSFLAPGAQLAVLEGDPTASSGDYTVRLKMRDGYRIAPHWHPLRENVTVISGTFKVGMGDNLPEQNGSFPRRKFCLS